MKLFYKFFAALLLMGVVSCEHFEMEELLDNPNAVAPEGAEIDFLYNNMQLSFLGIFNSTWNFGGSLSRMRATTSGFTYQNAYAPVTFDGLWGNFYANLLPDVDALLKIAAEANLDVHAGSAKIMKAYALMLMVDLFNNVPYTEALQGTDIISPSADNGQALYAEAEALLDEAIQDLTDTQAARPSVDLYYGGDPAKWATLAKTLKLRIYNTTRLVDGGAAAKINAILAEGDIIDTPEEDFQFNYGNQRTNPNSRHFMYNDAYENTDGIYLSNYFMYLLDSEKGFQDPRLRFYFYRQDTDLSDESVNIWDCVFSETPDQDQKPEHYRAIDPDLPYCIASINGYFGRDHMNGSGIPPDGDIRTVVGLYPAGGRFDDDSGEPTQNGGEDGARGEGIAPILLSSFAYFMRAEAAFTLGTDDDPRTMLEMGLRASIDKVFSFTGRQDLSYTVGQDLDGNPISAEEAFLPDDEDIEEYITFVLDQYDAAPSDEEKLNVIMKEYYIALWGNGYEAYNNYRRTGMPLRIQPTIDPGGGSFLRTSLYPARHVNLNQNATQKGTDEPVWWDNNPAGLAY